MGIVAHTYYPSTQETEAGEVKSLQAARLYRKALDQKKKKMKDET